MCHYPYNTLNVMTFVQGYEEMWSISLQTISFQIYTVRVSQLKRKKIKGKRYLARWDKERTLTWVECMDFLVVLFHMPAQSNDVGVFTTQNARSVRFYWVQENSQSKLQWVSSIPLPVRQCHWEKRLRVLKFLIFIALKLFKLL